MKKDIIFKDVIKELVKDIAKYILNLPIEDDIELIDKEFTRIEKREADIVFIYQKQIIHIEIQNSNDKKMNLRMLRYLSDIAFEFPDYQITQYLIYIGKEKLNMIPYYNNVGINYSFTLIDMKKLDCEIFLNSKKPELAVLAILCDFKDKDKNKVIEKILENIKKYSKTKNQFNKNLEMLIILSTNRNLEKEIKKGIEMLRDLDIEKIPFYKEGIEEGIELGLVKGKVLAFYELGVSIEDIAKKLNLSKEEIINILREHNAIK